MTSASPREEFAPPRPWRRRTRYIPLAILLILSLLALGVGFVTKRTIASEIGRPAPAVDPAEAVTDTSKICRPPVDIPAQSPWTTDPSGAEAAWNSHAQDLRNNYFIGEDGWIFWNDYVDRYASQAVGRAYLTNEQVQQWHSYLKSISDALAAQNIQFVIEITPSTSSVYPEQLPAWMQALRGPTVLDQFMAASEDLPVVDMRADLIAKKTPDVHLYSWSNSHWTPYGAATAWSQIANCTNALYPDSPPLRVPEIKGYQITGDFNEWASYGVKSPGADWAVPQYADQFQPVRLTGADGVAKTVPGTDPTDASILPVSTSVADSWTGKSALIIRDSMGSALAPLWQQAYSPTHQLLHDWSSFSAFPKYRDLVQQYKPDVVILQLAERHLITVPPPLAGY